VAERGTITEGLSDRPLFELAASGFMTMHSAFGALGFTVNDRGVRLLEVIDSLKA
jgi:hypothetical protein